MNAAEDMADFEDDNIDDMYLLFRIANEQYAVEIACVTEIIGLQKIIEVPDVPHYVKGVINLRGQVIPVMDVRLRFNLDDHEYDDRTVIIVLEVEGIQTGLVVDGVSEVIEIKQEVINPPPQWQGNGDAAGVIKGMAKQEDQVNILLDIEKLLYSKEITIPENAQSISANEAKAEQEAPAGKSTDSETENLTTNEE